MHEGMVGMTLHLIVKCTLYFEVHCYFNVYLEQISSIRADLAPSLKLCETSHLKKKSRFMFESCSSQHLQLITSTTPNILTAYFSDHQPEHQM